MSAAAGAGAGTRGTAPDPTRDIWILVSAAFVIALGFGIVAPALPGFALAFGVDEFAVTVIISAFAATRLIFAPASGSLVQRIGERRVYLTGLVVVAVSTGLCALAQTYWQLLLFRSLGGIGSTMFTVSALGLLIRIAPPDRRGRVSGMYASSFLAGTVLGPFVGGIVLGVGGLRAPFVFYAVTLVAAAAVVAVGLRTPAATTDADRDAAVVLRFADAVRSPTYRSALLSNFANGWAVFGVRTAIVPLFVVAALGRSDSMAAVALAVFAVGNAVVLVPAGRWSDRYGRKPFLVAGLLLCGASTATMGISGSTEVFLVITFVAGLGSGLITPTQQAAVADMIGSRARGGPVLAAFQMAMDVGSVIGPLVAGVLVTELSYAAAFGTSGAILLIAAVGWMVVPDTRSGRVSLTARPTAVTIDPGGDSGGADTDEGSDGIGRRDGE
ncbi:MULTISPECIES: MFS transporter [Nocardiaceae]|uniref:MFS family permease n=1 Tax=Rhodococcoides corynebacterioides TaxID=53972 RepID=A0ABS2KT09_9NOCA|nr:MULTISPECIES: MFS transporter [Rhodococcus]MBM7415090.1 MFS family permease [Rhodococcus corynebacterioides]MBP1117552.1 MFS family permease [Rhodococcus sp. PvP016]